ncbi:hypothetical protein SAMN05216312_101341 [Cohnella sp. OV330]|uniref:hypothetical protein n=1 Tax=Cohnella sp. OV330 TaxID=1855288 RepID=UPI0008E8F9B1|nr:hypothetical protein [Cohnella sp. OV330]SFA76286.1 hypothetical protein SAMN05216312_101341 [Cohnella sp. OV330]
MNVKGTKLAVAIGGLCVLVLGGTFVVQSLNYAKANHAGVVVAKEPSPRPQEERKHFTWVDPKPVPLGYALSHPAIPADSDPKQ